MRHRRRRPSKVDDIYRHKNTPLFRRSNYLWNRLKLNQSFNIGSLNYLFRKCNSQVRKNWELFYFESGKKRKELLKTLPKEKRKMLEDLTLPLKYNYDELQEIFTKEELEINTKYGRTKEDLKQIASYFKRELQKNPIFESLTGKVCYEFVLLRVIHETYLGFQREWNTIHTLQQKYPQFIFLPSNHEKDIVYAIDCEVYKEDKLLCALQIKSSQYIRSHNFHMKKVRHIDSKKNQYYEEKYHVPVYYVFSTRHGIIKNHKIFDKLNKVEDMQKETDTLNYEMNSENRSSIDTMLTSHAYSSVKKQVPSFTVSQNISTQLREMKAMDSYRDPSEVNQTTIVNEESFESEILNFEREEPNLKSSKIKINGPFKINYSKVGPIHEKQID